MSYNYLHVPRPGRKKKEQDDKRKKGRYKNLKRGSPGWGPLDYEADPAGCKDLWCSVILQSFYDIRNGNNDDLKSIIAWLASNDFLSVCTFAQLEPEKVAHKLIDELSNFILPKEWENELLIAKIKFKYPSIIT